jgi:hypothetical protein
MAKTELKQRMYNDVYLRILNWGAKRYKSTRNSIQMSAELHVTGLSLGLRPRFVTLNRRCIEFARP